MAINFLDAPQTVDVDLAPYRYADGPPVVVYRLRGGTLWTQTTSNTNDKATVTFEPGESIVWLFNAPQTGDRTPPSIRFARPLPDSRVGDKVILWIESADETRLDRVELFIDGKLIQTMTAAAPFKFEWNASGAKPNVWHGVCAVAYDASGNASQARIALRPLPPAVD